MDSELLCKVIQGIKAVAGIESLLVLPVAALHLAVVAGCVGADEFVADAQLSSGSLKQSGQIPLAVGKPVGKLKAIVGLDAFHPDAPAGIPLDQPFQEVGRRESTLLGVGREETQAGELINGGVLEQAKLLVSNTPAGYHLHIYLDPLAGIGHLFVRLGFVCFFLLGPRKHPQLSHDPEQALWATGIAPLPQPVP